MSSIHTRSLALAGSLFTSLLLVIGCSSDDSTSGATGGTGGSTGGAAGSGGATGGTGGSTGGAAGSGGATGGAAGASGGAGGAWACVGHVQFPQAPAATLDITRRFYHFSKTYGDPADYGPFEGATVDACAKGSDCSTPSDTSVTDAQGDAKLTLPTPGVGFEGYLRVHGTDIVPLDLYMLPPIADATSRFLATDWKPVVLLTSVWANFTQAKAGAAPDPTKGHVITSTMDCDGVFTSDVTVTVNGLTPQDSAAGDSVFVNVTPGAIDVVAKLGNGTQVAHLTGTVVAGEILALHFGPTP